MAAPRIMDVFVALSRHRSNIAEQFFYSRIVLCRAAAVLSSKDNWSNSVDDIESRTRSSL
jgi:hypothetical protein